MIINAIQPPSNPGLILGADPSSIQSASYGLLRSDAIDSDIFIEFTTLDAMLTVPYLQSTRTLV